MVSWCCRLIRLDVCQANQNQTKANSRMTYLQLLNRNSHVNVGSNGSRNWRVAGTRTPHRSAVAANVFGKGPGASLTDSEKMAMMARNRYCASYMLQGWVRRALIVSEGESDVSREAMDDVTDWRL